MTNDLRQRVVYQGHVQGVGFRATTASIARGYPVVGYVKNLRDGSVELVVEGTADAVGNFLSEIDDAFRGSISRTEVDEDRSSEAFTRFRIRY